MSGKNKNVCITREVDLEKAKYEATQLLNKYKVKDMPVDLVKIAKGEGISEIITTDLSKVDGGNVGGFLMAEPGVFKIYLNKYKDKKEQMYILAHELGHYMMHKDEFVSSPDILPYFVATDGDHNRFNLIPIEVEADAFAKHILLPNDIFMKYFLRDISIEKMSDISNVPIRVIREKVLSA